MNNARQKKVEKVMREFKRGKLKSHGEVVKNRRQAIAIALSEAGLSKYEQGGEFKTRKEFVSEVNRMHKAIKQIELKNGIKIKGEEIMEKGGGVKYKRPDYSIKTSGSYVFKANGINYDIDSYHFERYNDTEDLLEIQDDLRGELGGILIKNSAWKKLSSGKPIMAHSTKGNLKGTIEKVSVFEKGGEMSKYKFAEGGEIGKDVTFRYYDEERSGRVIDKLPNGYEVSTDSGMVLVEPSEVISFSEPKKKRFGFFEDGGSVEEYKQAERDYDRYGEYLEDAIEEGNEPHIKKYKKLMEEAESKMHKFERKYAEGGEIESKIKTLETTLNSKYTPEFAKEKIKAQIDKLKAELHESKETKVEEKKEDKTLEKLYSISSKAEDLIDYKGGGIEHYSPVLIKKYVEFIKKEVSKLEVPFDSEVYDSLKDANYHSLNLTLGLLGFYKDSKNNGDWAKSRTSYKDLVNVIYEINGEKPKIEYTEITQAEWDSKKKHGYTSIKDGVKYILTNENGATVLAPVKIKKEAKAKTPKPKFKVGDKVLANIYSSGNKGIVYEVISFKIEKGEIIYTIYNDEERTHYVSEYKLEPFKESPKPKVSRAKVLSKIKSKKEKKSIEDFSNDPSKGHKRNEASDKKRKAKPLGKRVSASGKVYYENRLNRADFDSKEKFAEGGEIKSKGFGLDFLSKW